MKNKEECSFKGCKSRCEELSGFSQYYDHNKQDLEELKKVQGKWYCKEHFNQIEKKVEYDN